VGSAKKKRRSEAERARVLSPQAEARRRWLRTSLVLLAGAYLACVWLDSVGSNVGWKFLPRTWVYFTQVAALFTDASPRVIDYRAEGFLCAEKKWVEIDVRPYFPLDADTKENRFQRALQFFRHDPTVMRALEDYVVERYDASSSHAEIGGVRFLSLRLPYPAPGEHVEPYVRRPLAAYPERLQHTWHITPISRIGLRCRYQLVGFPDQPFPAGAPPDRAPRAPAPAPTPASEAP
jgi:hypothetical protein